MSENDLSQFRESFLAPKDGGLLFVSRDWDMEGKIKCACKDCIANDGKGKCACPSLMKINAKAKCSSYRKVVAKSCRKRNPRKE